MKSICVYCGSSTGVNDNYRRAARELGRVLVENNLSLVYGGGNIGLMGVVADSVLECGGKVIGVIPQFLFDKKVAHTDLTELIIVSTMHERKMVMQEKSDGFICMPGGLGTMEEIVEMISWGQLMLHSKPSAFLNVDGYFNDLQHFFSKAIAEGFVDNVFSGLYCFKDNAERIIDFFKMYKSPIHDKLLIRA
jgi:uncharacterized protein (TIGR00730 family)